MNDLEKLLENSSLKWRDNKGIGTFIIPPPLDSRPFILDILIKRYNKDPTAKTMIVVDDWASRTNLINYLTQQDCKENNDEFDKLIKEKQLIVMTRNGVVSDKFCGFNSQGFIAYSLIILYNLVYYPWKLHLIYGRTKYRLTVLDKLLEVPQERTALYKVCPVINNLSQAEFDKLRTSTPVEEELIDVELVPDSEAAKLLDYYNEYIATSLNIFGNFDIMQEARIGNDKFNISANQICYQIAEENGWTPNLDMSSEINVQIDGMYNPNNLKQRATQTYEMIRSRSELLSNYEGKLDVIDKLVHKHRNEKILIISKRGSFARDVTSHLNMMFGEVICGDYHDHVDLIPEVDDRGRPVCYKSGAKAGKQRFLGAQAQKTRNAKKFATNGLNVLSTNNAPDKDLSADVSVVIITSPQCETIESYLYRLANVCYPNNKIILYTIYIKNSLEEKKLLNRQVAKTHTIVNNCENRVVVQNNYDCVIVD